MSDPVDYAAVIADLERQRDALNATIAHLRQVAGLAGVEVPPPSGGGPASPTPPSGNAKPTTPTQMRSDTFFGQKAPAAIRTYLGITKQPQTIPQIVDALKNHGYNSAAQDLYNNLYTALLRMEGKDKVRKLPDGRWGLAEWYPASAKRKKADTAKQGPADADEDDEETTAA